VEPLQQGIDVRPVPHGVGTSKNIRVRVTHAALPVDPSVSPDSFSTCLSES
jgi:hypothetical protein